MERGGDPLFYESMKKAIKRMSFDYEKKEKSLKANIHRELPNNLRKRRGKNKIIN